MAQKADSNNRHIALSIGMKTSDMCSMRSLHMFYVAPRDQNKNQRIE